MLMFLFSRILHKSSKYREYSFKWTVEKVQQIEEFEKPKFEKSEII